MEERSVETYRNGDKLLTASNDMWSSKRIEAGRRVGQCQIGLPPEGVEMGVGARRTGLRVKDTHSGVSDNIDLSRGLCEAGHEGGRG